MTAMRGDTAFVFPAMSDLSLVMALLAVIAACAVVLTTAVVCTARDLRRIIRRADRLLPGSRRVLQLAGRTVEHAQRIVGRVDGVVARVQHACEQAYETAGGALGWFGNGNGHHRAGAVPRRHTRRGR